MADTKISALTAVTTPAAADEFAVNESGTSKKITAGLLGQYSKPGNAMRVVAASNADAREKLAADYICDGVGDEVEINAAITAIATLGGKIQLTEGAFHLANPILINQHGIILEGAGPGDPLGYTEDAQGTTIYPTSGFTGAALIVAATGTFGTSNPVSACHIKDLSLDGSDGTNTTPLGSALQITGLQWSSFSGSLRNLRVSFMSNKGVHISGKTTATTWSTYDSYIVGLLIHNNNSDGFYLDNFAEDLQIYGVVSHGNKGDGIDDRGSSNQFINCHTYDNGDGGSTDGITAQNVYIASTVARSKFSNCKIEHAEGKYGVYCAGSEIMFTGCSFHNNGEKWGAPTTAAVTFTAAGSLVTQTDHRLLNADTIQFSAIVTTTGISINTTYFVISRTSNTFQVSLTAGGSAITLTGNGSGTLVRRDGGNSRGQIYVLGSDTQITGCHFGNKNSVFTVGSAIELDAASSGTIITGNHFQGSFPWVNGPIYDPGGASNTTYGVNHAAPGERKIVTLGADHVLSSTTGTLVFKARGMLPGTYQFRLYIRAQSATVSVSPMFGLNFTGTAAVKNFIMMISDTGGLATGAGTADDVGTTAGSMITGMSQNAYSTTAPNMGATGGVATINSDTPYIIQGFVIVTVAGDLEFWHGSETATSTTVKIGTSMVVERVS